MGYGGWLIYSAAVENAKKAFPAKKIIVVYPTNVKGHFSKKTSDAQTIFKNNPNVFRLFNSVEWILHKFKFLSDKYLVLNFGNKKFHHHDFDSKERISYKKGKHAIQHACSSLNIQSPELTPRIYLCDDEIEKAQDVLKKNDLEFKKFICLEPGTKTEFTPNKAWPQHYWDELYDLLDKYITDKKLDIKIVQIGSPQTARLKNSVYLNGKLSFRETSYVLNKSLFLLAYIGGLTHLARASSCMNVVIKSAWEPQELTSYPGDIEFYTNLECRHCGLKIPCPINVKCMTDIKPTTVFEKCVSLLKN